MSVFAIFLIAKTLFNTQKLNIKNNNLDDLDLDDLDLNDFQKGKKKEN